MARAGLVIVGIALLALALWAAGQGAVSHSRAGQEDLTFWINHHGLGEVDVDGPVGFGDAARLLMRRRSNAEAMRKLRDRFVFKSTDLATLQTPDLLTRDGQRYVITQGRVFNLLEPGGLAHRILEPAAGVLNNTFNGALAVEPWKSSGLQVNWYWLPGFSVTRLMSGLRRMPTNEVTPW